MNIAAIILFGLLRLTDPSDAERARIEAFAADVARAVDKAPALPFTGPAARTASIAALLVIAWHESNIDERVIDCRIRGDANRSISGFQLMRGMAWGGRSATAICSSVELSASLALAVLVLHDGRCKGSGPGGVFAGYASGSCARPSKASRDMCARWVRVTRKIGIENASCDVRAPLLFKQAKEK